MKTFVKNILAVCAILSVSAVPASAYDFEVDGIYFNIVSAGDRTCEVTSGDTKYSGSVVIPESVMYKNQEVKIVRIGKSAFSRCESLTNITISNTIKGIGEKAFYYCTNLGDVIIPNSVTNIGDSAFEACENIKSVRLPENICYIYRGIFKNCKRLTDVFIPNSVIEIRDEAFRGCEKLAHIFIPNSIKSIGSSSFSYTGLNEIVIPNSVTSIGTGAFSNCENLKEIYFPENIKRIPDRMFSGCRNLKSVAIPETVTSIGEYAFSETNLDSIFVPKGVESIEYRAFYPLLSELKSLIFEQSSNLLSLWATSSSQKGFICDFAKSVELGRPMEFVERVWIGTSAGLNRYSIKKAFTNYSNTEKLVISDGQIFSKSNSFGMAIGALYNLKVVTISSYSGPDSFTSLPSLTTIILTDKFPHSCPSFTTKQYLDAILYVPKGSLSAYQNADGWKNFWDIREGDGSEESGIEEVRIPSEKQEIGRYDIQGRKVSEDYKGFVIIRYSDGSVRKFLNK